MPFSGYPDSRPTLTKISAAEPNYHTAFYRTTNGDYSGSWQDGTPGSLVGNVAPIGEVLASKQTIKKPVRPLVTTAKCVLANQIEKERQAALIDKVLSADVQPKRFPAKTEDYRYPENVKHGAENPLYATTAQAYGSQVPMEHQAPDRYFPSTNKFTKLFVDTKPRYTGLNTRPTPSQVHPMLDQFY